MIDESDDERQEIQVLSPDDFDFFSLSFFLFFLSFPPPFLLTPSLSPFSLQKAIAQSLGGASSTNMEYGIVIIVPFPLPIPFSQLTLSPRQTTLPFSLMNLSFPFLPLLHPPPLLLLFSLLPLSSPPLLHILSPQAKEALLTFPPLLFLSRGKKGGLGEEGRGEG